MLESLFNKVAGMKDCNCIKKRFQHRCFSVNLTKFSRTAFLQNTSDGWFLKKNKKTADIKIPFPYLLLKGLSVEET